MRMAVIQMTDNTCWGGRGEAGLSCTADGNVKWFCCFDQSGNSSKSFPWSYLGNLTSGLYT